MPVVDSFIKGKVDQIWKFIDKNFDLRKQYKLQKINPTVDGAGRKTGEVPVNYYGWGMIRPISDKTWEVSVVGVSNSSHAVLYAEVEWNRMDGASGSTTPTTGDYITGWDLIDMVEREFVVEQVERIEGDIYIKCLLRREYNV